MTTVNPPTNSALCTLLSGVPVLLWGPPGIGKTSWLNAHAKAMRLEAYTLIGSIIDPTDVGGLLTRDSDCAFYLLPEWFKKLEHGGILILDELTCAPPSVQAGMLRVVAEKRIHARQLSENTLIAACANPSDQAASGYDLSPPMANRFAHYDFHASSVDWERGLMQGWPEPAPSALPENWLSFLPDARSLVAGFIRKRPELLHQMPKDESQLGKAWPSPRTWDLLCKAIAAHKASGLEFAEAASALIGPGAGQEFTTWVREVDLPDPELVLDDPAIIKASWPDHKVFATLGAVSGAWARKPEQERFNAACSVMLHVATKLNKVDLAFVAAGRLFVSGGEKKMKFPKAVHDVFTPICMSMLREGITKKAPAKKGGEP